VEEILATVIATGGGGRVTGLLLEGDNPERGGGGGSNDTADAKTPFGGFTGDREGPPSNDDPGTRL
jgi:hypothetical protein